MDSLFGLVSQEDSLRPMGTQSGDEKILLVCPTMWDECEIPRVAAGMHCRVLSYGTDVSECPESFDALDFIERAVEVASGQDIDGVMASDDYPGSILAAAIARRLHLPGPSPEAVLLCQHKYYARVAQRGAVPEAVPAFALLHGRCLAEAPPGLSFPLFVKPVKSFFSLFAQEVTGPTQLWELARRADQHLREFVRPFNQLLRRYTTFEHDGGHLLAEEPLRGHQVTVEGCVFQGDGRIIGITDSVMYPGTISFERFEYPSALDRAVQERMATLALRFMRAIGFDDGLFNIEMFYDPERDAVQIIEVNPRMCPQFADLMEKVNGVNTYEIALSIAAGRRPAIHRAGRRHEAATSFALRLVEDQVVTHVPGEGELAAFRERFPDARLKVLCREGHRLSEELQDGNSFRYAVLNVGGSNRAGTLARCREMLGQLPFVFEPVRRTQALGWQNGGPPGPRLDTDRRGPLSAPRDRSPDLGVAPRPEAVEAGHPRAPKSAASIHQEQARPDAREIQVQDTVCTERRLWDGRDGSVEPSRHRSGVLVGFPDWR